MSQAFDDRTGGHGAQGDVEEFSRILGAYNSDIGTQGRLGLFSAHKAAEDVCMRLLNALFGWSLENRNAPGHNEEAVDLVDDEDRIVVQVTATCSRDKINDTLGSERTARYHADGYRLKFAFVGFQDNAAKVQSRKKRKPWRLANPYGSDFFDPIADTLFSADLVARFQGLDPAPRARVLDLARGDIGVVTHGETNQSGVCIDAVVASINLRLLRQRRDHPSFVLMNRDPIEALLPDVREVSRIDQIPNKRRRVRQDGGKVVSFRDYLRSSWRSDRQTHLFIVGRGGVGKTVALLTFATEDDFLPKNVPTIYIPLNDLSKYSRTDRDCINEYLASSFSENHCRLINRLSHEPWNDGPRVIFLLDGYNEIPADIRRGIDKDVRSWATRVGTQLVTTSRVPGLLGLSNTKLLELKGLTKDEAKACLDDHGIQSPEPGSSFWRVLKTPLMLKLFADVETFRHHLDADYLRMRPSNNAGHLIWNYLQCDLFRCVEQGKGKFSESEYAAAILLTMPYVCWLMESKKEFSVSGEKLTLYVNEACDYWLKHKVPDSFRSVEINICSFIQDVPEDALISSQKAIISEETGLFARVASEYSLMHQHIRDGLAAVHLNYVLENSHEGLPGEFKHSISVYVNGFLSDVAETAPLLRLWDVNRRELRTHAIATTNLLRIIHKHRHGNLSELDWSGMDLKDVSLFGFVGAHSKLLLSHDPKHFRKTVIYSACFSQQGHSSNVNSVDFSPDNTLLASCSDDGTIRLWDVATHLRIAPPMEFHERTKSISFSPNGLEIASGFSDGTVRLSNVKSGKVTMVHKGHRDSVRSVHFSPDGSKVASGSRDSTVRLWDIKTGKVASLAGHIGGIMSVRFSPDGSLVASGSRDGTVRLWDAKSGASLGEIDHYQGMVTSVCFDPTGHVLASGSTDGIVRLRDVTSYRLVAERSFDGDEVRAVCFAPSSSTIAVGLSGGAVLLIDPHGKQPIKTFANHSDRVASVSFSSDGSMLATGSWDRMVRLWNPRISQSDSEPLGGYRDRMTSVHVSRDGTAIASGSGDGTVRIWDSISGRQIGESFGGRGRPITSICFSPGKEMVAGGSRDGSLCIWNHKTGRLISKSLGRHRGSVTTVHFSPDGMLVASGSSDGAIYLWEADSGLRVGKPILGHRHGISSVRFSMDGKLLASGSWDGTARLWSVDTRLQVDEPLYGHGNGIGSVRFSPDKRLLASGSWDGTIRLWDVETRRQVGEPLGWYWLSVKSICFSPDGSLVAGGTSDGSVYVWDVSSGRLVNALHGAYRQPVDSIFLSRNGEVLATGLTENTFWLWNKNIVSELADDSRFTGILEPLFGIDLSGLDFSMAIIEEHDREVLRQNGVVV